MAIVWGYIGTTKIIELNPEKKQEAFERGLMIYAERRFEQWKNGELVIRKINKIFGGGAYAKVTIVESNNIPE